MTRLPAAQASVKREILVLFFIQLFAALTYSALYSTLIFYATKKLHMGDNVATAIIATFIAFNYALHLLGGYFGGRFFSYRGLYSLSIILIVTGGLVISLSTMSALYWGLAIFLTGAGTSVTCLNCMVTQLFTTTDNRRESAFILIYSGMNIGLFLGYSLSGYYQLNGHYQQLFLLSSMGTSIALIVLLANWKKLGDRNTTFKNLSKKNKIKMNMLGMLIMFALIPILHLCFQYTAISNRLIEGVGILALVGICVIALQQPSRRERHKMLAYAILSLAGLIFWTLYLMTPMGLNLFIARNVDRQFLGYIIAPQWIQNINALVIIIGGPLLAWSFKKWRSYGVNISAPVQFTGGLFLMSISFMVLIIGIQQANAHGFTHMNWILISCCFYSLSELFIGPIGYSMVGRLAPAHLQSLMMGSWMMITGVAATISSYFSNKALSMQGIKNPLITNTMFSHVFTTLSWMAIGGSIVLLLFVPFLNRLMHSK